MLQKTKNQYYVTLKNSLVIPYFIIKLLFIKITAVVEFVVNYFQYFNFLNFKITVLVK